MRKIDRLFEIVQILRGQRLRTAAFIADKLGVSVRTIYRDMQGLMASGVPIEGERGVGYVIQMPLDLPPLHFTPLELQALQFGVTLVRAVADPELVAAAEEAAIKIRDALPSATRERNLAPVAYVYFESDANTRALLSKLRTALDDKRKIKINYVNEARQQSQRILRPLGLEYWGKTWTLTAWCELREDFRVFRIDRIETCALTADSFKNETGKTYKDYLKRHERAG